MQKGTGYGETAWMMAGARLCTKHIDYTGVDAPPSPDGGEGGGIVAAYLPPDSPAPADIPDLAAAILADAPLRPGAVATEEEPAGEEPVEEEHADSPRPEPWEDGAMWKTGNAKERGSWIKDTLLDGAALPPQTNVAGTSDPFREFLRGAARFYIARASPAATWAGGRLRAFERYSQRFQHGAIVDLDRFQGRSAVRHYKNYCFFYKYVSRGAGFAYDVGMRAYFVGQEAMTVHRKQPSRRTRSDTAAIAQPYIVWYFDHSWVDLPAPHTAVLRELLGVGDAKVNAAPLGQWSVLDAVATAVAVDIPDMCTRVVEALTNDIDLQSRLSAAASGIEPSALLSQWRELRAAANKLRQDCDQLLPAHMTLGTGTEHIVAALALVWRVDIVLLRHEDGPWVAGSRCGQSYTGPLQADVKVRTPVVLYQPAQSGDPWRTVSCIDPMNGETTVEKPGAKVLQPMAHGEKNKDEPEAYRAIDAAVGEIMQKDNELQEQYAEFEKGAMTADDSFALTEAEVKSIRKSLRDKNMELYGYLGKSEMIDRIKEVHSANLTSLRKKGEAGAENAVASADEGAMGGSMVTASPDDEKYVRLAAKVTGLLFQTLSYDARRMLSSGELKNIDWIMAMDTASKTLVGAVGYSESEVKVLAALREKEGTGGVLLTHAIKQMRGDTTKLTVESVERAVGFYKRMGFIECEKKKGGEGEPIKMQREASEVQLREKEGVTLIKYEQSEWGDDVILGCVNDVASSEKIMEVYQEVVEDDTTKKLEKVVRNRDTVPVGLDREFQLSNGTFPGLGARLVMYEKDDGNKIAGAIEVQLKKMVHEETEVEITTGLVFREDQKEAEIVLSAMVHYLIATAMDYDDGTDGKGGVRQYEKIVEISSGRVWYGLTKENAGALKWVGKTHRERFKKYADTEARALVKVCGDKAGQTSRIEFRNMEWGHLELPVSYSFGNMVVAWFEDNAADMAMHPEDSPVEEHGVHSPSLSDNDVPMGEEIEQDEATNDELTEEPEESKTWASPGQEEAAGDVDERGTSEASPGQNEAAGDAGEFREKGASPAQSETTMAMVCEDDDEITRKIAAARENHKHKKDNFEEQKRKKEKSMRQAEDSMRQAEDAKKKAEADKKKEEEETQKLEESETELKQAAEELAKLEDEHRDKTKAKIDEEINKLKKQKQEADDTMQRQMQAMREQLEQLQQMHVRNSAEFAEQIRVCERKRDAMDSQATEDPESNKRQKKSV
jgi:hypothetical protein